MCVNGPKNKLPVWKKFNRLLVLWEYRRIAVGRNNKLIWQEKLLCDCWNITRVRLCDIEKWRVKSCGCYIRDNRKALCWRHKTADWESHTRFYGIYNWIKSRCERASSASYKYYWWKWVKNLRWSYADFKNDMYDSYLEHCNKYWEKDTVIDRMNWDWDYCKENYRWVTYREQNRNLKSNVRYLRWWDMLTLPEIYEQEFPAVKYRTFFDRVHKWYKITDALFTPCLRKKTKTKNVLNK